MEPKIPTYEIEIGHLGSWHTVFMTVYPDGRFYEKERRYCAGHYSTCASAERFIEEDRKQHERLYGLESRPPTENSDVR